MHGDTDARSNYMVVNYMGALRHALIDLAAWVEQGIEPLNRTAYALGEDGQIHPEQDVRKRFGIQAIPTLLAGGEKCARVKVGECVHFTVDVQVPVDAGEVTEILFTHEEKQDAQEDSLWETRMAFEKGVTDGVHTAHGETFASYDKPGTYFAAVRIASNRNGDAADPYTQVLNLDRVRIIVS